MKNIMSADNRVGIFPFIIGPSAVDHIRDDKYFSVENATFIGRSPDFDCEDKMSSTDPNYALR